MLIERYRTMDIDQIKRIKKLYEKQWLQIPEVVAVGVGLTSGKETGIIVSVSKISAQVKSKIPTELEGVPVEINESGKIEAF